MTSLDKLHHSPIPVITIDGPGGSGKGTVSLRLARTLDWHFLDSGAIYRVLALAVMQENIADYAQGNIEKLAVHLDLQFKQTSDHLSVVLLSNEDVTSAIRTEACGQMASKISSIPGVRAALLERQRAFKHKPGLIADGRDMGTIVFPEAPLKIFLDASVEERAKRRCRQLQEQGISVNLDQLVSELVERDNRDKSRAVSPLKPAADAVLIDTTNTTVEQVTNMILNQARERGLVEVMNGESI